MANDGLNIELTFNIQDYVSKAKITEIAEDEARKYIRHLFNRSGSSAETFVANVAYGVVWNAVDDVLDNKARELITAKTIEIINELSPYSVFRVSGFMQSESKGQKILDECVDECRPDIVNRVRSLVSEIERRDIRDCLETAVKDAIAEVLSTNDD